MKRKKLKSHDIEIKDYYTHITIVKAFHFSATLPSKTFIYSYSANKILSSSCQSVYQNT